MKDSPENFSIIKHGISFHSPMYTDVENFYYGTPTVADDYYDVKPGTSRNFYPNRGLLTPKGFKHMMKCIEAMLDVLGDDV